MNTMPDARCGLPFYGFFWFSVLLKANGTFGEDCQETGKKPEIGGRAYPFDRKFPEAGARRL